MLGKAKRIYLVLLLASAASLRADIDSVRDSVVLITTDTSRGGGVVVGSNGNSVYIVTALHVVCGGDTGLVLRDNLRVTFNAARDRAFVGHVFQSVKPDLDLAVVVVETDDAVRQTLKRLGFRATAAVAKLTPVGSICHAGGETWVTNEGVNKIQDRDVNTFSISTNGIAAGCSGGPLLDDDARLLGVITRVGPAQASVLAADAVFDAIAGWNIPVNLSAKDDNCWCIIRSNPDGASVLLNGSSVGVTPLKVPVKEGSISRVRLLKDGYNEITHDLSCGSKELTLALDTADCKVTVASLPSDATVTIDGRDAGTTPTTVQVPQRGTVAMHVEKDGYGAVEKVIDCQRASVTVRLEKAIGTIKLAYSGDQMGCSLNILVKLGDDKRVRPNSNLVTVHDVPLGEVSYEVSGQIGCPMRGVCSVSGAGTVMIHDGDTIQVVWSNTGYAACDVTLVNPNE